MQIIPVIDLKQGCVVHARHGDRSHYQPIQSLLCAGSKPHHVIAALLELYPFTTLYIADIDAITSTGNHFDLLLVLANDFPHINFWVDCGIKQMNHRALHHGQNIRPVIGSENMENLISYKAVSYACGSRHVLSLDYQAESALGTDTLFNTAKYWPEDLICMSLQKVGSRQGVDIDRLQTLQNLNACRKTPSRIFAAGGVNNIEDIKLLNTHGIQGALIATSLHQKQITTTDLIDFYRHIASI
jgi:phosphoribosylformimino-5-aminoimidazole carboxamide ribotide isomerase